MIKALIRLTFPCHLFSQNGGNSSVSYGHIIMFKVGWKFLVFII